MNLRIIAAAFAATAALAATLPAAAGAGVPIPKDCHEWNELLHIDNVRSCDDA